MVGLIFQGEIALFALLIAALVLSLSCHEFGHAYVAKLSGDDTAERAGRLTLNPVAHIDPMGLLMVVLIGFGYAKPVPTDPRNFRSRSADLWVAAAGPAMNLILAAVAWNFFLSMRMTGAEFFYGANVVTFFSLLVQVNLLLMIFNMIPLGPLDGHYILPYFLPERLRRLYIDYNARYGVFALLALIVAGLLGVPVFSALMTFAQSLLPYITFVA
ncbi:MAG: site-2 protease family protein [Gammaproteobacteria bacterium]|nr:site-2 protease family protein [Gammaproteobacteria bacterium]MDE0442952.1 site-2 protease family protein [Gammaproteobacteria bacterium]